MSDHATDSNATSTPDTASDDLVRPLMPRRRRWARIAIATALVAQSAALYAALAREQTTRVVTRVEHTTTTQVLTIPSPPVIVTMPVAAPPTATETRVCPTPRTDAPHLVPPQLDEDVTGLAVSPTNAGWIALWNDNHVFVSTDAGRTFHRALDGHGVVHSVQFDCFGHAIVARGDQLGVAEGARETWRAVPGLDVSDSDEGSYDNVSLIGGGRDLIVLGMKPGDDSLARLAVSRDLGASWTYHDMSDYSASGETVAGLQRADGSILVGTAIPDCMTEDISWLEIAPDGKAHTQSMQIYGIAFQFWGDSIISTYSRRKINAPEDVPFTVLPDNEWNGTPIPAPYPVFVTEDKAARLIGKKLWDYPWKLEGEHQQMDPAGRLWSIACGKPWIARADRISGYCVDESDN